MYENLGRERTF